MKHLNTFKYVLLTGALMVFAIDFTPGLLLAQQLPISDFAIFSGNGGPGTTNPGADGYGVMFAAPPTGTSGAIGSYASVTSTASANIAVNINSGGTVTLANGNSVSGKITAANTAGISGTVLQVGSNANLTGKIDVNGNIVVGSGVVAGPVTTPGTYTGPAPLNGVIHGAPSLPILPALPSITNFPAAGSTNITANKTITPGSYGNVTLGGSKTLTFNGAGTYVFNSINLNGNNNFVYNFQNLSGGVIKIYVYGDVTLSKLKASTTNGGSASQIYLETHGTGASSTSGKDAFTIKNDGNAGGAAVKFLGTVWAPYAAITIGSGPGVCQVTGALYSGTQVVMKTGAAITYSAFVDCTPPVANAGSDVSICSGESVQIGSAAVAGNTYSWSPSTGLSSSTVANPTVTLSLAGPKTYTVTVTSATCTNSDQVVVTVNPLPVADAGSAVFFCSGGSATLGSAPVPGNTYSWSPSTGLSSSTVANPTITLSTPGIKTYTLTVTSTATGCIRKSTVKVTVNPVPNVGIALYSPVCVNAPSFTLTGSPAGGTFSGPGVTGNTFNPAAAGVGLQTVSYTYSNGTCTRTATSDIQVNGLPDVSAGLDAVLDCSTPTVTLHGSSSSQNASYNWTSNNGGNISAGANTLTPTVNLFGNFSLTVTDNTTGCSASDDAAVTFTPCILPGYSPPDSGKTDDLIGSELTSLFESYNGTNPNENIFIMQDSKVMVEVIYNEGKYNDVYNLLIAPPFNATLFIDNGTGNRIITTEIEITQLGNLNNLNITTGLDLINYVRPVYPPIPASGIAYTLGDKAQKSDLVRHGFAVDGEGIKVGVLSNSYNKQLGNQAAIDVLNGDLPGTGNPNQDTIPVQVLMDYPFGIQTDEGRAMLQIIHDVAPKAQLAFRTGFISAGNMAQGIKELQQAGCNVEVDDVTYITEPFFSDGMISQAVNDVTALGVSYFTSAGNYGDKSYEGTYKPAPAPGKIVGTAHDFGGGDVFQNVTLTPGSYLMVLQWEDDFYSLSTSASGTSNDLDIYLTYDNGITLFGFNRNNIGSDPVEVLPFTVTQNTNTNILITRASGTGTDVHFKYVVFQVPTGGFVINEFNQGNATIVGQANAEGAITTGAVLYSNTPAFGVNPPTKASFSSIGGTLTYGVARNKPDLCAPNGGNTTVQLGGTDIDGDQFPNFFGTSAAAPHAAGIAALLLNARQKYYGETLTPAEVRNLLTSTATDMYDPGFDYLSGYGLVNADSAMRTFAAPAPSLVSLDVPQGVTPGPAPFLLTVTANYITTQSQIVFRDDTLPTTWVDGSHLSATIPAFTGNPSIGVCTPAITPDGNDGGCSALLNFFSPLQKNVVVVAANKTKLYGEKIPEFSATITVDGVLLDSSGYTLADLGLDDLAFSSPATSTSNVGIYFIQPYADVSDAGLQELYDYTFTSGLLTINKMPLVITPVDQTITYGDKIDGTTIGFSYKYDTTKILPDEQAIFLSSLKTEYESAIVPQVALINDEVIVDGHPLANSDIENLALMCGGKALVNGGRPLVNSGKALANGTTPDTTNIIDLAYQSLVDYNEDNSSTILINGHPLANGGMGLVNGKPLANGLALANGKPLANGLALANSSTLDSSSNTNLAVIIHDSDVEPGSDGIISAWYPINLITGTGAGEHFIGPAGFLTPNFEVTYGTAHLTILPYELKVVADDQSVEYGTAPSYTSKISGYQYDDSAATVLSGNIDYTPASNSQINVGSQPIVPSGLSLIQPANYYFNYGNGTLAVSPATLTATADNQERGFGFQNPPLTISYSGFKFSDDESVIDPAISIGTTAIVSSSPGLYPITLSGGAASNYNINRVNGTLTVDAAAVCSINPVVSFPVCNSTGNVLTALAPAGYTYSWSVSGTGWQITGGNGTLAVTYTAGGSGTIGTFVLTLRAPITNFQVSTCTLLVSNTCNTEYCAYGHLWETAGSLDCNGLPVTSILPMLLSTPLVNGDGTRKITIGTTEALCVAVKLPAGNVSTELPVGNVSCANATGSAYLKNGKFKSNLLGQEIGLALSLRYDPTLSSLRITGPFITTYSATSCTNGTPVEGTKQVFEIPGSVITYLGANNTVADLLNVANKGLGATLSEGAPSLSNISAAVKAILDAFDHCRIFAGFSETTDEKVVNADDASAEINNLFVYPNPASGNTTISFVAPQGSHATLDVYGINGSLESRVLDGNILDDGMYSVEVDCSNFTKGLYFVRLTIDEETLVKKLVIIK